MRHLPLLFAFLLLLGIPAGLAQQRLFGTVTDSNGAPLPGASVAVKGAGKGTTTDADGKFDLSDVSPTDRLRISYLGYQTAEVVVGDSAFMQVILVEVAAALEGVIITGYSEISAKKRVASVSVINSDRLENSTFTDVNKLLQGNAAGVYSSAISGQPGATSAVRIRGVGSLTVGQEPLYVVDGVITVSGNATQLDDTGPRYTRSDILAQINPNDIESVTVLKDAAATALYGARGANGVVVMTTKRGKAGKTNITVRSQAGVTMPGLGNLKMMTPEEQWNYDRAVLANSGQTPEQIDARRPSSMLDNPTNWLDEAFNDGATWNIEAQAQGGSEKTRFFGSIGYFDQQGTVLRSDFNRLSLRSNIDHSASDRLRFALNLNGSYSRQNAAIDHFADNSIVRQALLYTPLQSKTNPATGQLFTGLESDWIVPVKDNFLYSLPLNPNVVNTYRMISKLSATYDLTEHWQVIQMANVDWLSVGEKDFDDPSTNSGLSVNGYLANASTGMYTATTQTHLKYANRFGADHSFDALGVFEWQYNHDERFFASGKGFASGKLQTLSSAATPVSVRGSASQSAFLSFLGQTNYAFQDRYVFTASLRRDGSSRFGANRRWANFWSLGASWHLSEEAFLKNAAFFDLLRLRASYGTSGNADIGDFTTLELYAFNENYLGQPGSAPAQISNPDLGWEKSATINVGLDFSIWDHRIGGSVEWYRRDTRDMLLNAPVSATTGFSTAIRNVGKMRNSGVEATLNLVPIKAASPDAFGWNADFNIAFNDNKIVELPNRQDIIVSSRTIWREGEPVNALYLKKWAGVNPDDGTPLWYLASGETTGDINKADRFIVGRASPDYIAGLTNTFSWKGISLSFFLYAAQGHSKVDLFAGALDADGGTFGGANIADAANFWKQPGDVAERPRPSLSGNKSASTVTSTRYLEDASFVRLRNLSLAYQFPQRLAQRLKTAGIRAYVQGQNLWTLTDYPYLDPEGTDVGVETFRYPAAKSLVFGLDIAF